VAAGAKALAACFFILSVAFGYVCQRIFTHSSVEYLAMDFFAISPYLPGRKSTATVLGHALGRQLFRVRFPVRF